MKRIISLLLACAMIMSYGNPVLAAKSAEEKVVPESKEKLNWN